MNPDLDVATNARPGWPVRLATLLALAHPAAARRLSGAMVLLAGAAILLLVPAGRLHAQEATLTGTVTSATGAAASGATVTLVNASGDEVAITTTDDAGNYRFASVPAGSHRLRVTLAGFREADLSVDVDDPREYVMDVALDVVLLDEIVVTATRDEQEIGNIASAVSVVTKDEIQRARRTTSLEEPLRRVPGVRVEDELGGTGSRTRIIVRGVGTRANSPAGSGVRGVRVLVDGIPKNNAGGSAQDLINIDLGSVERIEVLKGPSSALYGNQSGGVVNILTEQGPLGAPRFTYRQTVGSYGLLREHGKLGGGTEDVKYLLSGYRTDQDGYRDHSRFHSTGFQGKLDFDFEDRSSLTAILGYDRNFQESPGPLTRQRFDQDPTQADSVFLANNVRSTVDEFRLGLVYRRELVGQDELELTGFYVPRHLGPFVQIGVRIPQDFMNRGANLRYTYSGPLGGRENRLTFGSDYQNTPITTGTFNSLTGAALAETEENATTLGIYALEEFSILENLLVSVGGRFDTITFTSRNLARPDSIPTAGRTFEKVTPKVGLSFQPIPALSLYANYARGFETPIIGELRVLPGGVFGFNEDLDPQTSANYEVGARGAPLSWLTFETALYRQDVTDLISPIGTFPNNTFQNVGEVDQLGVELGADVQVLPAVIMSLAYTYADYTIEEFRPDTASDFSGNRLPGVPRHTYFAEARYQHPQGFFAAADAFMASPFFFDNANTESNPQYEVVNVRVGYEGDVGGYRVSPFVAVNNVFDEKYSAFALINDTQRRFFNPLPETNVYGGVSVTF